MQQASTFPFVEMAAKTKSGQWVRNVFLRAEHQDKMRSFIVEHASTDIFMSVCRFKEPNRRSVSTCELFFDIDGKDLGQAREDTLKTIDCLFKRVGVPPEALDIRFSGSRGFHLLVSDEVFGTPATENRIQLWRSLARRLYHQGIPSIDLGVYQPARVLRVPNTINSKCGLYDVPLDFKELQDHGAEQILELARQPREWQSMASPAESPPAAQWLYRAQQWIKNRAKPEQPEVSQGQGWRTPPCVRAAEAATLPDGSRHKTYFVLCQFYESTGMHPDEALERLIQLDQRHPIIDSDYLMRVVRLVYQNRYRFPRDCPNPDLEAFCKPQECFLHRYGNGQEPKV